MFTRFLVMSLFAAALTACGDAADFRKKVINSDNGEPLILFAAATYETARSFMTIGDLLDDGVGFCVSGDAVFVAPPAPAPEDIVQITFTDCVDDNGITYNGTVSMKITAYTDWENLAYSLLFNGLTAESDWFGGRVDVSDALSYDVAGKAGSIELPDGSTFTTSTLDTTEKLELNALNITVELDADNAEITETSVDGSGEQSNTEFSDLAVTLKTPSVLKLDTSNADLLCPRTGQIRVTTTEDDSYASVLYPSETNNVYQVRTNGSLIRQYNCT